MTVNFKNIIKGIIILYTANFSASIFAECSHSSLDLKYNTRIFLPNSQPVRAFSYPNTATRISGHNY